MNHEMNNYPLENIYQFAHYHPLGAAFILVGIFIILIILCLIIYKTVNVLDSVINRVNTFKIGDISFNISDKSLKSTDIESLIHNAIMKLSEQKLAFENETWNLINSKYVKDPYKDWQYATYEAAILSHNFAIELQSSKGNVYIALMCEDNGHYFYSLYLQADNKSVLDEAKKVPKQFASTEEIELYLSNH